MGAFITFFQSPFEIQDLIECYNNDQKTNLDILLENAGKLTSIEWTVPKNTKNNDIVVFMCASSTRDNMMRISNHAREIGNTGLVRFVDAQRKKYRDYIGKIVAVGTVIGDAYQIESPVYDNPSSISAWYAKVSGLRLLDHPIPSSRFRTYITFTRNDAHAVLNESQWKRLEALILQTNPAIGIRNRDGSRVFSIYEEISKRITDGRLPEGFLILDNNQPEQNQDIPGARDGVYFFHINKQHREETAQLAEQIVSAASAADYDGLVKLINDEETEVRAIELMEDLHQYVQAHLEELNQKNIFNTAWAAVINGMRPEVVKVGLELTELFGQPNDEMKNVVRSLALYDEFTLFAIWHMNRWDNSNEEIFSIAQKLHGWGKIHAVEWLKPETDEIRQWLIKEGTINGIDNNYSALNCWEKGDAWELLKGKPSEEQFLNLCVILKALMADKPLKGISAIEHAVEQLGRFLAIAYDYPLTLEHYELIASINSWGLNKQEMTLCNQCKSIISSQKCRDTIQEALRQGEGIELATFLGIPYEEHLEVAIRNDFYHLYHDCRFLFKNPEYVEKTLDIIRQALPMAKMKGDPKEAFVYEGEDTDWQIMEFTVQQLDDKPMTGIDFIETSLESPFTRNRYCALECLKAWIIARNAPLVTLNRSLYWTVLHAYKKETDPSCDQLFERILAGDTEFSEPEEEPSAEAESPVQAAEETEPAVPEKILSETEAEETEKAKEIPPAEEPNEPATMEVPEGDNKQTE